MRIWIWDLRSGFEVEGRLALSNKRSILSAGMLERIQVYEM